MCKAKKKADIIASMDPKFRTNWPLPHYEQLTEEDNLNNRSNINIK